MAPAEFSIRLQKGITGGFAPPTPDAIHTLDKSQTDSLVRITSAHRSDGTPSLGDAVPKSLDASHADDLVEELHGILSSIPTESPPGSQDIYGLDTGIAFACGDFMWYNGGPQGCGGGESFVQPTSEDKAKFARAVEIVNELVGKGN
ncbi:hypothetical protein HGRIS_014739 [Hohenbuehelia grisea]|uniref:Uncharacterized protein n=1 Tax=Hohenbuehelia grisea TaxID=104357 RepID=A0ABR3IQK6_9AGAR